MSGEVEGIEECCADLGRLQTAVAVVAVTRGLHAAAEVIEREIDVRTPVRSTRIGGDKDYQALITDLQVKVTLDARRGSFAEIGFFRSAYLAQWIEYGHRMVGHKPNLRFLDKWVPARPFLRPAADAAEEPAVQAFTDAVSETLAEFSEGAA